MKRRSIALIALIAFSQVLAGIACLGQGIFPTSTPYPTFPPPTPRPAPIAAAIQEVCNYDYATVTGQITIGYVQMSSTEYHLDLRGQEGDQVYLLLVYIPVGSGPNMIEPLSSNFEQTDVRIHTNSGGIVENWGTVTITGTVSHPASPNEEPLLPCNFHAETIESP